MKFLITVCRSWLQEYNVLLSAKLQMLDFCISKNISLLKILKSNGRNIEPWGIPRMNLNQSLKEDPTLILYLRLAK